MGGFSSPAPESGRHSGGAAPPGSPWSCRSPPEADLPVEQVAGRQLRVLQAQLPPGAGVGELLRHVGHQVLADAQVELRVEGLAARPVVEGPVAGGVLHPEDQFRHGVQPLADGAAPAVDDGQAGGAALLHILLHGLLKQHPLGVKVPVAQALHHPHAPGDVRHGGVLVPLLREQLHGRVQNLLPPHLRRLGYTRHCFHLGPSLPRQ